MLQAKRCNFIKTENPAHVLSYEFLLNFLEKPFYRTPAEAFFGDEHTVKALVWEELARASPERAAALHQSVQHSIAIFDISTGLNIFLLSITQPAFTCSKITIETLAQGVKHVQS